LATNFIVSGFGVISVYMLIMGFPVLIITEDLRCKGRQRARRKCYGIGKRSPAAGAGSPN
jgi:hypothetical protein